MNFIKLAKWTTPKSLKKLFSVNCLSGIGEPEAELELQAQNQTETHTHPKPITRNQDRNGAPSTCPWWMDSGRDIVVKWTTSAMHVNEEVPVEHFSERQTCKGKVELKRWVCGAVRMGVRKQCSGTCCSYATLSAVCLVSAGTLPRICIRILIGFRIGILIRIRIHIRICVLRSHCFRAENAAVAAVECPANVASNCGPSATTTGTALRASQDPSPGPSGPQILRLAIAKGLAEVNGPTHLPFVSPSQLQSQPGY